MKDSTCIEKIFHEGCGHNALQVFAKESGTVDGYCFYCHTYVPNPYGEHYDVEEIKTKKAEAKDRSSGEVSRIHGLGTDALVERKLRANSLSCFGIKTEGKAVYFPARNGEGDTTGYKCKLTLDDGKKIYWSVGEVSKCVPFGWFQALEAGGMNLYVTEGELDAVAIHQVLTDQQRGTKWEGRSPSVISLPHGSSSVKALNPYVQEMRSNWKQVICAFDMDEPGEKAAKDFALILPGLYRATLPANDANDALMQGRSKMLATSLVFSSTPVKNTSLINANTIFENVKEVPKFGLSWPWSGITKMTRGIRPGETIYIGAGVKMGKGEVAKSIAAHLIREHGMKIFMANLEETTTKSIRILFNKLTGKFFHDPEKEFDPQAYERAVELVGDRLLLLDKYQHASWSGLKASITQAVAEGARAVFIDPITNLTNGLPSSEANTLLQSLAQDISAEAMDKQFTAFLFCHLKAPPGGKPHEKGGEINSTDFAGSRAMMRSCNYMFGLHGDRSLYHEVQGQRIYRKEEEINRKELILLEDREFGEVGKQDLYWNPATGLFEEV